MAAPMLSAREITLFDDTELDRYLRENGRLVSVRDPENLPESFVQRLRDRVTDTNRSIPIDLDEVSVRLLRLPDTTVERAPSDLSRTPGSTPPSRSGTQSPPDGEDLRLLNLGYEKRFYSRLLKKGGRPWYPIDLLDKVSRNPTDYRDILRFWQGGDDTGSDDWAVYSGQYYRWKKFLGWQTRRRQEFHGRIEDYTKWATRFLSNRFAYSAPREFSFSADPKLQDPLTTWIEYLTYESNIYAGYAKHSRPDRWYEAQWQKVVDSGLLRPHETREFALQPDAAYYSEETQAQRAVELARVAASSAAHPLAQQRLEAAEAKLESIKRHHNLISKFIATTRSYRDAKQNAERHAILLQWIREQIQLIQQEAVDAGNAKRTEGPAEGGEAQKPKDSADAEKGQNKGSKRLQSGEEPGQELQSKKQKGHEESRLSTLGTSTDPRSSPESHTRSGTIADHPEDLGLNSPDQGRPNKLRKPGASASHVAATGQPRCKARIAVHKGPSKSAVPDQKGELVLASARPTSSRHQGRRE